MKQQLTIHIDPALADYLRAEGARLGVSLSSLVERLLTLALESEMGERTYRMVEAGVTAAIQRAIQQQANRLAHLTAHTAINAGIAAELAVVLVAHSSNQDQARKLRDQARYRAARHLKDKFDTSSSYQPETKTEARPGASTKSIVRAHYLKGKNRSRRIYALGRYNVEISAAQEHAKEQLQWRNLENEELSTRELVRHHREHQGQYTYFIVLSPDPEKAGSWNQDPERINQYVRGVLGHHREVSYCYHPDPQHPHLHAVIETDHKFSKGELQQMRERSDEICHLITRQMEYERTQEREREEGRSL